MPEGASVPNRSLFSTEGQPVLPPEPAKYGRQSTYLRQAALLVILAHMGCSVPCHQHALFAGGPRFYEPAHSPRPVTMSPRAGARPSWLR